MPPSICALTMSGLTAMPQSTAQTTRSTLKPPSGRQRDLGHLGDVACSNDSWTAMPRTPGPAPAAVPQPAFSAASSSTPQVARLVLEQAAAELDRVLAGRMRQLVDEHLGRRRRCGSSRPSATTAPARRRRSSPGRPACSGSRRAGCGPLDRGRVDAVLDHHGRERRARHDRLADDAVLPGRRACRARRGRPSTWWSRPGGSGRPSCRPRASTAP